MTKSESFCFSHGCRWEQSWRGSLHSWRTEAEIVCCGQWLAVRDSRGETLSIAMVPEQQRSSPATPRPVAAGLPTLGRSLMFRCEGQSTLMHPDDSLSPVVVNHDDTQPNDEQDENGKSSTPMQVSLLIHLQDPHTELLPHVVNVDSD